MILKPELTAAVIGHPITHSRSPLIHNTWLRQCGIDGQYEAIDVAPEDLEHFCSQLRQSHLKGINVTLPHKETIMRYCDKIEDAAQKIGAVNTIIVKDGHLIGTNTDAYGFIRNLEIPQPDFDFKNAHALIIGAGGASRAVIYGLLEKGIKNIFLSNRTQKKANSLAKEFDNIQVIPWDDKAQYLDDINLLINTTSLGMKGQRSLELDLDTLPKKATVYDLVYNPKDTTLLKNAAQKGCKRIGGLGMLIYQAERAFELWFDQTPDATHDLVNQLEESLR